MFAGYVWWPCEWTSCSISVWPNVVTTVLTLRRGFSETECYCSCASPDIDSYLRFVPPATVWVLTCVLNWMPTFYTSVTSLGSNSFRSRTGPDNHSYCICAWYLQSIFMFITECRQFLQVCLMIRQRCFKHILSETDKSYRLVSPHSDSYYLLSVSAHSTLTLSTEVSQRIPTILHVVPHQVLLCQTRELIIFWRLLCECLTDSYHSSSSHTGIS
jgi:hypothetical protein